VGHETDFSLADFAADVRAPTPSAAAELVVPDRTELSGQVAQLRVTLQSIFRGAVEERRWLLNDQVRTLSRLSPEAQLVQARQRVDELVAHAVAAVRHELRLGRERLVGLTRQLESIGPQGTLERGYAIVRARDTGLIVRSVDQVEAGDELSVRVSDGEFGALTN
jgi:exodeoxyribonuclease VII large subunit